MMADAARFLSGMRSAFQRCAERDREEKTTFRDYKFHAINENTVMVQNTYDGTWLIVRAWSIADMVENVSGRSRDIR